MSDVNLDHLRGWRSCSVIAEFQDLASFLNQELVFIVCVSSFAAATEVGDSYVSEHLISQNAG